MTNEEKMLKGEYYISWDKELTQKREQAKDLLFEFNNTRPSLRLERQRLIQKLFQKTGENCWIESPFNCDYGCNITVGDNFYANTNCCILDCAKICFGDNVWIGGGAIIMPGVTIGDNVVVGAGSVVTRDIPANVVAAGNPCRVLRPITAEDAARWEVERDAYFRAVAAEAEG